MVFPYTHLSQEVAFQSSAPSATASSSFTWPCAVGSAPPWHCQALGSAPWAARRVEGLGSQWGSWNHVKNIWKYMKSTMKITRKLWFWWSDHWNMVDDWWWLIWTLNISELNSRGIVWTCSDRSELSLSRTAGVVSSGVWWSCGGWVPILWPWTICEKHGKHGTWEGDETMINHDKPCTFIQPLSCSILPRLR